MADVIARGLRPAQICRTYSTFWKPKLCPRVQNLTFGFRFGVFLVVLFLRTVRHLHRTPPLNHTVQTLCEHRVVVTTDKSIRCQPLNSDGDGRAVRFPTVQHDRHVAILSTMASGTAMLESDGTHLLRQSVLYTNYDSLNHICLG